MVGHRGGAGVARAQEGGEHLPGGVGGDEHGVEPEPVLVGGTGPSLFSEWISTRDDSRSTTTGHHRLAPPSAATPGPAPRPSPPTTRRTCSCRSPAASGTAPSPRHRPEQPLLGAQVLDVRARLPPPPASISMACTSTFPRSCSGRCSPVIGCAKRGNCRLPDGRRRLQERKGRRGPRPGRRRLPPSRGRCF